MRKAVLISIRPKWCELIASRRKTLELRTRVPVIPVPYKCYIYCTNSYDDPRGWLGCYDHDWHKFGLISPMNIEAGKRMNIEVVSGKVIGEFICDGIMRFCHMANADLAEQQSCVKREKIYEYSGRGEKEVKGMHISDLVIYDKPKELSEFYRWWNDGDDIRPCQNGKRCQHLIYDYLENCEACAIDFDGTDCPHLKVKRPPQSWCYVEEET